MKRLLRMVTIALALVLATFCSGSQPDDTARSNEIETPRETAPAAPLTLEKIQYATIHGVTDKPATLYAGVWLDEPARPGVSPSRRLDLIDIPVAETDLDGDGAPDMAVLLQETDKEGHYRVHLAAIINDRGSPVNRSTVLVGDHVQVLGMSARAGKVGIELIEAGPQDPSCCPTRKTRRTWTYSDGSFREGAIEELGRTSVDDIEGSWRLVEYAHGDPVPMAVRITAVFDDGKLSGSSGCNDYFTSYRSTGPGEISLGMIGATKKACPDEAKMLAESKYLAILPRVSVYGFQFGRLALTWADGQATATLSFERLETTLE